MKYNISYLTGRVLLYIAFFFVLYLLSFHVNANEITEKIRAHDPVLIVQDDTFYLFSTGMGISVWSSKDMEHWQREESVFISAPEWTTDAIPEFRGHMWAPDIFYYNDLFYLYYSVSSFGRNNSFIGVVTNKTLHPESPDFQWIDHGPVIQSIPGRDLWNAIDPNVIIDKDQIPWMTFGSFWAGIKLFRLNEELTAPSEPQQWHTIAARERDFNTDDHRAGNAAIEAPFIFQKGKYYYLFVSYDHCCRGISSTYKIMVGRSENITGPYLDKDGTDMAFGGASLVLEGNEDWPGVGHNAAYTFNGKDFLIFHGYDAHDEGRSKLLIREILWDEEDWPVVEL
jgi:arabinan endo-1,5-alpha-L-arabinosidase